MPRYKLMSGVHTDGKATYYPGAVFDGPTTLERLNSPDSIRFTKMPKGTPLSDGSEGDDLDGMTVAELRKFAAEAGVAVGDKGTKAELVAILRSALEE